MLSNFFFDEDPNHFKMAMSHVTEQFAKEWYNQKVDPTSEDRDPKHAQINRKHIPIIWSTIDRNERPIHRVTFKHYTDGRFKLRNNMRTIYQKNKKRVSLKHHKTLQDAEKHMYSDIYNYLHPIATTPAQRKQKNQNKERAKRANARTMGDEQVRRTQFQLLMEDLKKNKEGRENQRGKLRPRKRKYLHKKSEACPSKKQKNQVERTIQTKKEKVN